MHQRSTGMMPPYSPLRPAHGVFGGFTKLPSYPNHLVWEYALITEIQGMQLHTANSGAAGKEGITATAQGSETTAGHPGQRRDATHPHFPLNPDKFQLQHRVSVVRSSCRQAPGSSSWHQVFFASFLLAFDSRGSARTAGAGEGRKERRRKAK